MKTISSSYVKTRRGRSINIDKTVTKYNRRERKINKRDFLLKAYQHPEYQKTKRAGIYSAAIVASAERATANLGNSISQTGIFGKQSDSQVRSIIMNNNSNRNNNKDENDG